MTNEATNGLLIPLSVGLTTLKFVRRIRAEILWKSWPSLRPRDRSKLRMWIRSRLRNVRRKQPDPAINRRQNHDKTHLIQQRINKHRARLHLLPCLLSAILSRTFMHPASACSLRGPRLESVSCSAETAVRKMIAFPETNTHCTQECVASS